MMLKHLGPFVIIAIAQICCWQDGGRVEPKPDPATSSDAGEVTLEGRSNAAGQVLPAEDGREGLSGFRVYTSEAQTPSIPGRWTFGGCSEVVVDDPTGGDNREFLCQWSGTDGRGRDSQRSESFRPDGTRVLVKQSTIGWERVANKPADLVPLDSIPGDSQTPKIPGDWKFLGCEIGLIWDAHYVELWMYGHLCTWSDSDGTGRQVWREERFTDTGTRVSVREERRSD